jgi:hypothetical protein
MIIIFPPTRNDISFFHPTAAFFSVYCVLMQNWESIYLFDFIIYIDILFCWVLLMMMNEEKIEMRINDAPRLSPIVKAKTHFSFHDFPPFEFFFYAPRTLLWMRTNVTLVCAQHASLLIFDKYFGGVGRRRCAVCACVQFLFVTNRSLCK